MFEINVAKCDMCKNIISVKETKQSQDADDTNTRLKSYLESERKQNVNVNVAQLQRLVPHEFSDETFKLTFPTWVVDNYLLVENWAKGS